jgi:hypothetical protein
MVYFYDDVVEENSQLYLSMMNLYEISADGDDVSQQDGGLPSISIQIQSWEDQTEGLQFHSRSSSTIPATMNKENSVLRISFSWIGDEDSRIVIKVVKELEILFEIEDWTYDPSHTCIERYYNSSHDFIKNLKEVCHFELHYANFNSELHIEDFNLSIHGKLSDDVTIDAMSDQC